MKKRLLGQNLFMLALSVLISVLIIVCSVNLFLSINNIPITVHGVKSETVIIKDGNVQYTTLNMSTFDEQGLLLAIKSSDIGFKLKDNDYSVEKNELSDGTIVVMLNPKISLFQIYKIIFFFSFLIFISVYIIVMLLFQKNNDRDIIKPLIRLKNQTKLLRDGEFEVNIPDEGFDEINELGKEIEQLRIRLKEEVYLNKKSSENRKFLISSMSHDLRTPVTALKGYVEGVLDGVANTDEKRELYLKKSLQKIDLINQMISDLLLYSKLDLNQVEFKYQRINIRDYLKNFADDAKSEFEQQNKQIYFIDDTKSEYNVNIDVQQFDRVMSNITTNALKYINEITGKVDIILRENISSIIIEVKDNGTGIDEKDIQKIFDRFYRCEKSRQIKGSSGLGLAISKQIVENMNGRIWAVSKVGVGTSIIISLKKTLGRV